MVYVLFIFTSYFTLKYLEKNENIDKNGEKSTKTMKKP